MISVYGMITHWVIDSADAAVETRREKKRVSEHKHKPHCLLKLHNITTYKWPAWLFFKYTRHENMVQNHNHSVKIFVILLGNWGLIVVWKLWHIYIYIYVISESPGLSYTANSSVISSNWIKKLPAIWIRFQIKTQSSAGNHTDRNPQQDTWGHIYNMNWRKYLCLYVA